MPFAPLSAILFCISIAVIAHALVSHQDYTWKNIKIGGGGGYVPDIVFNPTQKGLAYAR